MPTRDGKKFLAVEKPDHGKRESLHGGGQLGHGIEAAMTASATSALHISQWIEH
jgi:hypothetical protein